MGRKDSGSLQLTTSSGIIESVDTDELPHHPQPQPTHTSEKSESPKSSNASAIRAVVVHDLDGKTAVEQRKQAVLDDLKQLEGLKQHKQAILDDLDQQLQLLSGDYDDRPAARAETGRAERAEIAAARQVADTARQVWTELDTLERRHAAEMQRLKAELAQLRLGAETQALLLKPIDEGKSGIVDPSSLVHQSD